MFTAFLKNACPRFTVQSARLECNLKRVGISWHVWNSLTRIGADSSEFERAEVSERTGAGVNKLERIEACRSGAERFRTIRDNIFNVIILFFYESTCLNY